jgi:hypothetical protein
VSLNEKKIEEERRRHENTKNEVRVKEVDAKRDLERERDMLKMKLTNNDQDYDTCLDEERRLKEQLAI